MSTEELREFAQRVAPLGREMSAKAKAANPQTGPEGAALGQLAGLAFIAAELADGVLAVLPPAGDEFPVDFEWLAAHATRHVGDGPDESVWWEIGPLSFTCESYQSDPGEPTETVAADWQVDGEELPSMLVPKTRGEFRGLLRLLKVKVPA